MAVTPLTYDVDADADVADIAALTPSDGDMLYWASGGTRYNTTPSTSYIRGLLNTASEAALKAAVNLEIGVDVQAYDADLTTWAGLTPSAFFQTLVDDADAATARATLGLTIGTHVQAYDADLTTWAGVTPGTGVATALGVAVGSAGAVVVNGGALGTPSSGTLTNATGLPISTGVSGLGTGIATALAINTGSAGAPVLVNGALGTPSSGTLTNATGLPVGGISGLGTGVATFLATPSSANLAAAVTDESGSGALLFAGGALGTPASGVLTNCTGLPNASVVGLGTAATVNTGTSGATIPLLNGTNTFSANTTFSGAASALELILTGATGVATPAGIHRSTDADRLIIAGGDTTAGGGAAGSRVVLFGDAHASTPSVTFYDATTHIFRDSAGGATTIMTINGVAVPTISSTDTLSNKTLSSPTLSGTVAGLPTFSGAHIHSVSNATTYGEWIMLRPTDYAAGKPQFYIAKSATATQWDIGNWDGSTNAGAMNFTTPLYYNGVAVPTISSTDTLTNKTLSSPTLSGTVSGTPTWSNVQVLPAGSAIYNVTTGLLINNTASDYLHTIDKDNTGVIFSVNSASRGFRWSINGTQEASFYGGVVVGAPTGGAKGVGTINCTAAYDDNVLLTDLVLDYAVTNTFDAVKYANHPLKDQVSAWMFNPDQYAEFWKAERRLPGMLTWDDPADKPSTGESITRLTAVVEMQAALIENLNQRLKELEQ